MQERVGSISREIKILRKNQGEMLSKNTVTDIKNTFDRLINNLDIAEYRTLREVNRNSQN